MGFYCINNIDALCSSRRKTTFSMKDIVQLSYPIFNFLSINFLVLTDLNDLILLFNKMKRKITSQTIIVFYQVQMEMKPFNGLNR